MEGGVVTQAENHVRLFFIFRFCEIVGCSQTEDQKTLYKLTNADPLFAAPWRILWLCGKAMESRNEMFGGLFS